jgi:hypothetical protein
MFFLFDILTEAQTTTTQTPPQSNDAERSDHDRDRDITRRELASFDKFLDNHHEIAEQVRKNPSLVDNQQFLKDHPALQAYVQQHPAVREELRENPNAFTVPEGDQKVRSYEVVGIEPIDKPAERVSSRANRQ